MLEINDTKEGLQSLLNQFIWEFKIGDNVSYNLNLVFSLIRDHNSDRGCNYSKPISILCVSIMEAILVDFLERLDKATYRFPESLGESKEKIKLRLSKEKQDFEKVYEDETFKYRRLRNFGYKDIVSLFEEFSLLGSSTEVYVNLQNMGRFRNRVHIRNYFGNFERNESRTFSEVRTQKTINYMSKLFKYMEKNYSRK